MAEEKFITNEEIEKFMYSRLIENNLIPTQDEMEILSDIVFDFLIETGFIEEIED